MNIALVGTRWFGAQMLGLLLDAGHSVRVVATHGHDRLAAAAAAGVPLEVLDRPRRLGADQLPEEVDVIVAAHTHAFITVDALARAKRAAIGYHPSLLPRHRGIAAVEWTIRCRDPIAGGTVYHLSERIDAGLIAAQHWCFVYPDDDAASLWRRALAPLGLRLLMEVVDHIDRHGFAPGWKQDPRAVTYAPALEAVGA
jgi:methionyl-tRNA formyltransferase